MMIQKIQPVRCPIRGDDCYNAYCRMIHGECIRGMKEFTPKARKVNPMAWWAWLLLGGVAGVIVMYITFVVAFSRMNW